MPPCEAAVAAPYDGGNSTDANAHSEEMVPTQPDDGAAATTTATTTTAAAAAAPTAAASAATSASTLAPLQTTPLPVLPPPSSLLPPADPSFVGRVHDLGDICAALAPGSRSHNNSGSGSGSNEEPVTALLCVGPGGAGKSALLLEYLHLYEEEAAYTFVWWCDAHSEATLAASLRAIAGAAGLRDATGEIRSTPCSSSP